MKLDVRSEIRTIDGEVIKELPSADSKPATLKFVFVNALLANDPQENADGTEKYSRWKMADKINKSFADTGIVELTTEELSKLKSLIGKNYPAGVLGPVFDIIESAQV